jgi:hypothetical protein
MILKTFAYHSPSPAGLTQITYLREAFSQVAEAIQKHAPDSREKSVALTQLETAAMWAVKAVVFNDPESQHETS